MKILKIAFFQKKSAFFEKMWFWRLSRVSTAKTKSPMKNFSRTKNAQNCSKKSFFCIRSWKTTSRCFFLWKSIFQKNDVFYLWSINFSRKILQALEKIVFEKFNKFNISAFILCTFKCQKIFKIGSSNLKRSFRKSGSLFWKYGGEPPPLIFT